MITQAMIVTKMTISKFIQKKIFGLQLKWEKSFMAFILDEMVEPHMLW
ncbi:hypothetical protein BH09BAC3_BH09BAC3_30430 [soil metagenome]